MLISLHKQATTTPKVRALIQASTEPAWVLAERHGTTPQTIWKWRNRSTVHDRSHTPHHLQTTLSPAQEAVAVVLRRSLLLSLDDLLAMVREFLNPEVSHSGLDRCLRRHGVANLKALERDEEKWNPVFLVNHATTEKLEQDDVSIKHHLALVAQPPRPTHKPFKACEPGYLHVDVTYLPQMADESARRYLFVAIDPWPGS